MAYVRPNPAFQAWFEHRVIDPQGEFIVEAIAADARRGCPVDQGDLLGSIETDHPRRRVWRVKVGTDHWAPTEYGSDPHVITISKKKVLADKETGEIFGRTVHHPGTPEQPFMRPAIYRRRKLPRSTR